MKDSETLLTMGYALRHSTMNRIASAGGSDGSTKYDAAVRIRNAADSAVFGALTSLVNNIAAVAATTPAKRTVDSGVEADIWGCL